MFSEKYVALLRLLRKRSVTYAPCFRNATRRVIEGFRSIRGLPGTWHDWPTGQELPGHLRLDDFGRWIGLSSFVPHGEALVTHGALFVTL